mgnify:CR=1 FL=1
MVKSVILLLSLMIDYDILLMGWNFKNDILLLGDS